MTRPRLRPRHGVAVAWKALGARRHPRLLYDPAPPMKGYGVVSLPATVPLPPSQPAVSALALGEPDTVQGPSPGALNAAPLGSADVPCLHLSKLKAFVRRHEQPADTPYGPSLSDLLEALSSRKAMLQVSEAVLPAAPVWRPSKQCRAVEDAVAFDLMAPPPRGRGPLGVSSCFPVWKSDGLRSRLITWPEALNANMRSPFSGLGAHLTLREMWSRHSHGATMDMPGAFNQYPLSPAVQRLFCCSVGRAGRARLLCACRLPMGWCGSPAICQRTILIILRVALGPKACDAFAHVDNIYVGGSSPEDVQAKIDAILAVCKSLSLSMVVESGPSQQVIFLGLEVDLDLKVAQFKPAFKQKVLTMSTGTTMSYQDFRICVGLVLWTAIMSNTKLYKLHHCLWTLSDAARERASVMAPRLPSGDVQVPAQALDEMAAMQSVVGDTFDLLLPCPPASRVHLTTDASHSGGAAVWTLGPTTRVLGCDLWPWPPEMDSHINVLEMLALEKALYSGFPLEGRVDSVTPMTLPWFTDSMVSLRAVSKGFSGSRQLGEPLTRVLDKCDSSNLVIDGLHVRSEANIADRPSRVFERC